MPLIHIISTKTCTFCDRAKAALSDAHLAYQENLLDSPEKILAFKRSGFTTVPQIYIDGEHIGGHSDLLKWLIGYEKTVKPSNVYAIK